jgi:hypothetical protein
MLLYKTGSYGVKRHFQQYFSYIVAVSFIDSVNQSSPGKPPTCRKSLTNSSHNVVSSTPCLCQIRTHNVSGAMH